MAPSLSSVSKQSESERESVSRCTAFAAPDPVQSAMPRPVGNALSDGLVAVWLGPQGRRPGTPLGVLWARSSSSGAIEG